MPGILCHDRACHAHHLIQSEEQLGLLEFNRLTELLLCPSAEMPSFAPITLHTLSWLEGNWTSEKNLITLHKAKRMSELVSEYTFRELKGSIVTLAKALQETQSCLSVLRQAACRVVLYRVELYKLEACTFEWELVKRVLVCRMVNAKAPKQNSSIFV